MSLIEISRRLRNRYGEARYALTWRTPGELLVATILAGQSTDEKVNALTPALFAKYPNVSAFANADVDELTAMLKPVGLAPQKAKWVKGACAGVVERFGGQVPRTIEELTTLPGVGRKTANVVIVTAFKIASGVIVDTHVKRIAQRLGFSEHDDADDIEVDLAKVLPRDEWLWWPAALILFGRETCTAKTPQCGDCMLADVCPRRGVES
jgi:endonuclease-3